MSDFSEEKLKEVLQVKRLVLKEKFKNDFLPNVNLKNVFLTKQDLIFLWNPVKIYDKETKQLKEEFHGNYSLFYDYILIDPSNEFYSYDLRNHTPLCKDTGHNVYTYTLLKDGLVGTSSNDGSMQIYDPFKGCIKKIDNDRTISFYAMCQLADGNICGAGYMTGIRIYDINTGKLLKKVSPEEHKHKNNIYFLASPYPDTLLSISTNETKVWDLNTWKCIKSYDFGCAVMEIKVVRDYMVYAEKIVNYKTGATTFVKTRYIDESNIIVTVGEFDYWYLMNSVNDLEKIFTNERLWSTQDLHFHFLN